MNGKDTTVPDDCNSVNSATVYVQIGGGSCDDGNTCDCGKHTVGESEVEYTVYGFPSDCCDAIHDLFNGIIPGKIPLDCGSVTSYCQKEVYGTATQLVENVSFNALVAAYRNAATHKKLVPVIQPAHVPQAISTKDETTVSV